MGPERLSAWLDSYRTGLRDSLQQAAQQGYRLVYGGTVHTELDPRELSGSARRHLRRYLRDLGLKLDGLAALYPDAGLADPARADERFDQFKGMLELCAALGVKRATVSLSGFEEPRTAPLAREMCSAVAELADRFGLEACLSDPASSPELTAGHLRAVRCPNLRLALDTAHLPSTPAPQTAELVGTLFLRDVRRGSGGFEEVPFGQGNVDFAAWLTSLEPTEQRASLIIRHDSAGGVDALRQGREYIGSLIGRLTSR